MSTEEEPRLMNETRIQVAVQTIAKRREALKWLEQYGTGLDGRSKDYASVHVRLNYASACPGAKEAEEVLSSYAKFSLPEIVKAATDCCRNDIELATQAMREELALPVLALATGKREP